MMLRRSVPVSSLGVAHPSPDSLGITSLPSSANLTRRAAKGIRLRRRPSARGKPSEYGHTRPGRAAIAPSRGFVAAGGRSPTTATSRPPPGRIGSVSTLHVLKGHYICLHKPVKCESLLERMSWGYGCDPVVDTAPPVRALTHRRDGASFAKSKGGRSHAKGVDLEQGCSPVAGHPCHRAVARGSAVVRLLQRRPQGTSPQQPPSHNQQCRRRRYLERAAPPGRSAGADAGVRPGSVDGPQRAAVAYLQPGRHRAQRLHPLGDDRHRAARGRPHLERAPAAGDRRTLCLPAQQAHGAEQRGVAPSRHLVPRARASVASTDRAGTGRGRVDRPG